MIPGIISSTTATAAMSSIWRLSGKWSAIKNPLIPPMMQQMIITGFFSINPVIVPPSPMQNTISAVILIACKGIITSMGMILNSASQRTSPNSPQKIQNVAHTCPMVLLMNDDGMRPRRLMRKCSKAIPIIHTKLHRMFHMGPP